MLKELYSVTWSSSLNTCSKYTLEKMISLLQTRNPHIPRALHKCIFWNSAFWLIIICNQQGLGFPLQFLPHKETALTASQFPTAKCWVTWDSHELPVFQVQVHPNFTFVLHAHCHHPMHCHFLHGPICYFPVILVTFYLAIYHRTARIMFKWYHILNLFSIINPTEERRKTSDPSHYGQIN